MSRRLALHLVYLFLSVAVAFFWTSSPTLSYFNLQLVAFLVAVFFIKNLIFKTVQNKTVDVLILTLIVLLLVFSTGGAGSPLFFLVYFLLFGLSFLFEPPIAVIFSLILIIFLVPFVKTITEAASMFSLFLITPLALFFGQQYLKNLSAQKRIKIYQDRWLENEKSLENEETNVLMWLATVFRPATNEILDRVSQLLSDIGRLSPTQKGHLKRIRRLIKQLDKSGEKLKRAVDLETD
jgi:hypothetical protein